MLQNYMEELIGTYLDEVLEQRPEICRCERCKAEHKVEMLNRLPALYVRRGEAPQWDAAQAHQYEDQLTQSARQAVEQVSRRAHQKDRHTPSTGQRK